MKIEKKTSSYLKPVDLGGKRIRVTVSDVTSVTFPARDGKPEQTRYNLVFAEGVKPFTMNTTNQDAMIEAYGDESDDWKGKTVVLVPTTTDFPTPDYPTIRVWPDLPVNDAKDIPF